MSATSNNRKPLSPIRTPTKALDFSSPNKRRQPSKLSTPSSVKKKPTSQELMKKSLRECSSLRNSLNEISRDFTNFSTFFKEQKEILFKMSETKQCISSYESMKVSLQSANEKLKQEENLRRKLHNKIIEDKGNIRVFCRMRPTKENEELSIQKYDKTSIQILSKQKESKTFSFDYVYPMDATQNDVFQEIQPLITSAFDGYNVLIMSYGETSSGKTFTLLGNEKDSGIIQMSLNEMDSLFNRSDKKFKIHVGEIVLKFS
jgi:hypothetical protein